MKTNSKKKEQPSDSQMMDWLEKQGSEYYGWEVQTERDRPNIKGCVWLKRNILPVENTCLTAREAIAQAMLGTKGKNES